MHQRTTCTRTLGPLTLILAAAAAIGSPAAQETTAPPERGWTTAVEPKPLSEQVLRGLDWLVKNQDASGGWGQGEESLQMQQSGLNSLPSVGDTATATLALIRSGSTPSTGPYAASVLKGVHFILGRIEESDEGSLSITDVNGTRLQAKLGPYVDTFLTSVVLAEATGGMPDEAGEKRLAAGLAKVIRKIEINQTAGGAWDGRGWAPALANSMAIKGLNRARQRGVAVSDAVLQRAQDMAIGNVAGGGIGGGGGAAGVDLYAVATNISALQDSVNSNAAEEAKLAEAAKSAPDAVTRALAEKRLVQVAQTARVFGSVQGALESRIGDAQFIAGFGSNGGEEFLSYMNIGESLVVKGGDEWRSWDADMTAKLAKVQNADGTWTGHHCITGRTFCTATALMVLMVDRTPVPVEVAAARNEPSQPVRD